MGMTRPTIRSRSLLACLALLVGCAARDAHPARAPRSHWVSGYLFGLCGEAELDVRDDCPKSGAKICASAPLGRRFWSRLRRSVYTRLAKCASRVRPNEPRATSPLLGARSRSQRLRGNDRAFWTPSGGPGARLRGALALILLLGLDFPRGAGQFGEICPQGWSQVTVGWDPFTLLASVLTLFIYTPGRITIVCAVPGGPPLPPAHGYVPSEPDMPPPPGQQQAVEPMRYLVNVGEETLELELERRSDGSYRVRGAEGAELEVNPLEVHSGLVSLLVAGETLLVQPTESEVRYRQQRYVVHAESALERAAAHARGPSSAPAKALLASMPGRIVHVLCEAGRAVSEGAPLVVMEAMKMQNELCARADAVVSVIRVSVGQTVERGAVLIEFE